VLKLVRNVSIGPSYSQRFKQYKTEEIRENGNFFEIDEDRDGNVDYSFRKPDFNFVQFRSNLIVRGILPIFLSGKKLCLLGFGRKKYYISKLNNSTGNI